uniref:Uncharacterized protein n=1 Tax=Glossina palpalis gambiensis TaxID=67801 RepID=A0A1B0BA19_9MUSC
MKNNGKGCQEYSMISLMNHIFKIFLGIIQQRLYVLWLTGQASKVEKALQPKLAETITSKKIKPKILLEIKDLDESTEKPDIIDTTLKATDEERWK